jgi:hypothetical protein
MAHSGSSFVVNLEIINYIQSRTGQIRAEVRQAKGREGQGKAGWGKE